MAERRHQFERLVPEMLVRSIRELQQSLGGQLNTSLFPAILHIGKTKPSEAHRPMSIIDWVAALSSNYDGLIDGVYALASGGIVPPVFFPDGISQALDCLHNGRFFVFKVHGIVSLWYYQRITLTFCTLIHDLPLPRLFFTWPERLPALLLTAVSPGLFAAAPLGAP